MPLNEEGRFQGRMYLGTEPIPPRNVMSPVGRPAVLFNWRRENDWNPKILEIRRIDLKTRPDLPTKSGIGEKKNAKKKGLKPGPKALFEKK
jgi:hypothetical protein